MSRASRAKRQAAAKARRRVSTEGASAKGRSAGVANEGLVWLPGVRRNDEQDLAVTLRVAEEENAWEPPAPSACEVDEFPPARLRGPSLGHALARVQWTQGKAQVVVASWDRSLRRRVAEARAKGATWTQLGEVLGVSKQAVRERFRSVEGDSSLAGDVPRVETKASEE